MYARFGFLSAVLLAAALAACGGGGGGSNGGPPPTAPPPTATPAGPSVSVTFGGSATTASLPVPVGATYGGTITFAAGSGAGVMVASTTAPAAVTTLNFTSRALPSASTRTNVRPQETAPYTTASYITLTASSAISLSGAITASPSSGYQVAYYNSQGFWVTLPVSGTLTLAVNGKAYFAVYSPGTVLPSPNPDGCVGVQPDATTRGASAKTDLVGVQPITSGAAFNYVGTLTSTIARATPCAMPDVTATAAVTVQTTVSPGTGSEVHEDSTETDAYGTESVSTSTDAVVEPTSSPAAQSFAELSETTTDEVGDSTVTTYSNPLVYAIAAPLPFTGTITNGSPSTVVGTLADGTTTTRNYVSGGAYTETDTLPGTGSNVISVKANGSGSYNIDANTVLLTYNAPSAGSIVLSVSTGGSPQSLTVPAWFAAGTPLYSDTTNDTPATAFPSSCSPNPSTAPTDDFTRTILIVDPVLGYSETEIINSYVTANYAGSGKTVGPACVTIGDVQKIYYDYNYDTPYIIYASLTGDPMQTNTITEAYWFSGTPTGYSKVRTMSANAGDLNASIAAHASGIAFQRALERVQRMETLTRHIASHAPGGVK